MTKEQSFFEFFSRFGVPAYDENSVPTGKDAPVFPYITYSVSYDLFNFPVAINASIWDRDTSWKNISEVEQKIVDLVSRGCYQRTDGGAILLTAGSPLSQHMGDETDQLIKRVYMNITAEFIK